MSDPSKTTLTFTITKKNIWDAISRLHARHHSFATSSPLSLALAAALNTDPDNVYAVHTNSEIFVIVYKIAGDNFEEMFRLVTTDEENLNKLLTLHDTFLGFTCYMNGPAPKGGLTATLTKL